MGYQATTPRTALKKEKGGCAVMRPGLMEGLTVNYVMIRNNQQECDSTQSLSKVSTPPTETCPSLSVSGDGSGILSHGFLSTCGSWVSAQLNRRDLKGEVRICVSFPSG